MPALPRPGGSGARYPGSAIYHEGPRCTRGGPDARRKRAAREDARGWTGVMTPEESALRRQEIAEKRERLNRLLQSLKLDALLVGRRDNFAWVTAGGDNHVALATEAGEGYLLIEPDRWTLVATNIETPRLTREELADLPVPLDVEAAPWWQGVELTIERLIKGRRVGSDTGVAGTPNVGAALRELRLPLTAPECQRIRAVGRQAS